MESIAANIQGTLNADPAGTKVEASPLMSSNETRDSRRVQMPETRTGLSSTEGDLITMVKKYLEIVGLVFFVWTLGECASDRRVQDTKR
jgi:hypothetical protein